MTNQLPGNDHFAGARMFMNWARQGHNPRPEEMLPEATAFREAALVQSNLAIAYEQRTANMIRFIEIIDDRTDLKHRIAVLEQRLGLDQ